MNDQPSAAARLQAGQQGPLRHRGEPVRRPRRVDQHHAAHPAGERLRGHPPRPQPRVEEIVDCALQEDAHGIAISSYQGGHVEFFKYMIDLLRERGGGAHQGLRRRRRRDRAGRDPRAARLRRDAHLHARGRPALGLQGMINEIVAACDADLAHELPASVDALTQGDRYARTRALARLITGLESGHGAGEDARRAARARRRRPPRRCSASPAPAAPARARSPTS